MIVQELHRLQAKHGYLPRQELVALGERLAVPLFRIQEVVSFFPHYRTSPTAELEVHVCQDMACHLRGSAGVLQELREAVAGRENQLKICGASCLGRCDRAPAARIYEQSNEHAVYNLHRRSAQEIVQAASMLLSGNSNQLVANDTDRAWPVPQKDWQIDIVSWVPLWGNWTPGPEHAWVELTNPQSGEKFYLDSYFGKTDSGANPEPRNNMTSEKRENFKFR